MMREFAAQCLLIVLIAIGFGAVAHMIFLVFTGPKPTSESHKSNSFWSVFIQRTKRHVVTQLVLFALMVVAFIALGSVKQHPMPLSH